tara:strand:+ start:955 stop:2013 length:1059 start_codon:yes stop_codon:yes gene_type:complete
MPGKLIVDEIEDSGGTSVIGRKNYIINGGMLVSQRGTSFASPTSTDHTLDRWQNTYNQDTGATTISQSSTSPDLFGSSLKIDCTTAEATVDAGNYWLLRQSFEGQDLQNLGYGTSSAKALTISFWVYSTKTGTFAVSLYNDDAAKSYVADVTVNSASTWEKKTVTIAGDTASGFNNDNGRSLILNIGLNAGSTFQTTAGSWTSGAYFGTSSTDNFLDNTANDFYITGVQMEIGSVATDFEVRPIGEELSLCQRYYFRFNNDTYVGAGAWNNTSYAVLTATVPTVFRTSPTLSISAASDFDLEPHDITVTSITLQYGNPYSQAIRAYGTGTANTPAQLFIDQSGGYLELDAEL